MQGFLPLLRARIVTLEGEKQGRCRDALAAIPYKWKFHLKKKVSLEVSLISGSLK